LNKLDAQNTEGNLAIDKYFENPANEHANNMQLLKEAKDWDNDSSPEQNGDQNTSASSKQAKLTDKAALCLFIIKYMIDNINVKYNIKINHKKLNSTYLNGM